MARKICPKPNTIMPWWVPNWCLPSLMLATISAIALAAMQNPMTSWQIG